MDRLNVKYRASICVTLSIVLLFFAFSCGGDTRMQLAVGHGENSPVPGDSSGSLPSPADLLTLPRDTSVVHVDRTGADFERALRHRQVTVEGDNAVFSPLGDKAGALASAIYSFDIGGPDCSASLAYLWQTPPAVLENCYFGLADFQRNAWEWHLLDGSGSLSLPSLSRYRSASRMLYLAVVLRGTDSAALRAVGLNGLLEYDEVEDNDTLETAQLLPEGSFKGFRCSFGSSPGYSGPDGDNIDWFKLSVPLGQVAHIAMEESLVSMGGYEQFTICNASGTVIAEPNLDYGSVNACYGLYGGGLEYPYYIRIYYPEYSGSLSRYGDYGLSVFLTDDRFDEDWSHAKLLISPSSGSAPLKVSLDASGSVGPGPADQRRFLWDWEGDSHFDYDSGSQEVVQHTYEHEGVFRPQVRVYDSVGVPTFDDFDMAYDWTGDVGAARTLTVGPVPYDELEDNDWYSPFNANPLPAAPFSGWRGNVGAGPGAYDGDTQDNFSFTATPGQELTFVLDYEPADAGAQLQAFDGYWFQAGSTAGRENLHLVIDHDYPYVLQITSLKACNYTLRTTDKLPPEVSVTSSAAFGTVPVSVDFNAMGSDADGTVVRYEWLWQRRRDLDWSVDKNSGATGAWTHDFDSPGIYNVVVQAIDNDGLVSARAEKVLYACPHDYDELESNNGPANANPLTLPVSGFRGNIGEDGYYAGNAYDYFRLENLLAGQTLQAEVFPEPGVIRLQLILLDADGNNLASVESDGGPAGLQYSVGAEVALPCYLELWEVGGGDADYTLDLSAS